jgi:DNA-3-methyladenine glycosylase I
MTSYCSYVHDHPEDKLNKDYHDTRYGFPIAEDAALFERLVLEINQAGLSWSLILKRIPGFQRAYDGFDVDRVAAYSEAERARLLADPGVIRNRLKVNAAIENARRIQDLQKKYGSFKGWLEAHHPLTLEEWTKLFKKTFVFTGAEIVNEFLISTGYLPGAHESGCRVYREIARIKPPWMQATNNTALTHPEDR